MFKPLLTLITLANKEGATMRLFYEQTYDAKNKKQDYIDLYKDG